MSSAHHPTSEDRQDASARADDLRGLDDVLAQAWPAAEVSVATRQSLQSRLLSRAAESVRRHQGFVTWRRRDATWRPVGPGVRAVTLHEDEESRSELIELSPQAGLSDTRVDEASEWLVLGGALRVGSDSLSARDFHAQAAAQQEAVQAETSGALVFRRQARTGPEVSSTTRFDLATGWQPLREGVVVRPLCQTGTSISFLVRLARGARVPAHAHGLGEECLMVEGDLFLGDVLLREGDFQWAPAGSEHDGLYSDTGCLLFFRGEVDPCTVDASVSLEQALAWF